MRLAIFAALGAAFLTALGFTKPAAADPYRVSGIEVDVAAADAVTARDQAMLAAQREGLSRLIRRFTSGQGQAPAGLSDDEITRMVRSVDVDDERVSPTSYAASLSVAFDPEAAESALAASGAPVVLRPSDPLLVVPATDQGDGLELWAVEDAWGQAWRSGLRGGELLDIRVPRGDLSDQALLAPEDVVADDEGKLRQLAERYGATGAVVLLARPGEPEGALDVIPMQNWRWPVGLSPRRYAPAEEVERLAAGNLAAAWEDEWSRNNLVRLDRPDTIQVEVPIRGLEQWAAVRRGLAEAAEVRGVDIRSLSQERASLRLSYVGGLPKLEASLARGGLNLDRDGERWLLR